MTPHWSQHREGGGRRAIRLIAGIGLSLGRPFTRVLLYPITLYFYCRRPLERRSSAAFLSRVLGRPARAREVFRHLHTFAATLLDRLFLLQNRYAGFDVRIHGLDELKARMQGERGVMLLGAHIGSFDVLRVAAAERPDVKVRVVLDTRQTPALTEVMQALDPQMADTVIDASGSSTDVVLALAEAIEAGALTALMADRARPGEAMVEVDFLGAPAPFPAAPFLISAVLKVPVMLCFGLYRGGNRYDLYFEPFADELVLSRRERTAQIQAVVQRYAARVEHHVRTDPYNWFNWHDFWTHHKADDSRNAADRPARDRTGLPHAAVPRHPG